jgi:hypothetical protein
VQIKRFSKTFSARADTPPRSVSPALSRILIGDVSHGRYARISRLRQCLFLFRTGKSRERIIGRILNASLVLVQETDRLERLMTQLVAFFVRKASNNV